MITAETLRALLAQVEEAKAGSRELDARIWHALRPDQRVLLDPGVVFGPGDKRDPTFGELHEFPIDGWDNYEAVAGTIDAPPLTTSIDAALALVAKVLPASTMWLLESGGDGDHGCTLVFDDGPDVCSDWHVGPPSLAILVALLRALLQQSVTAHVER